MKIGLSGFSMTGKSTLFQLLTGLEPAGHAARGEGQQGITRVPDPRLDRLSEMYSPKKKTPATVTYLDLAGVEKGQAAKTLPLDALRTVDALAHVVRGFEDESIPHSEGSIDPARDVTTMEVELILADLIVAEKRVEKLELNIKKMSRDEDKKELVVFRKVLEHLEAEQPLRNKDWTEADLRLLRGYTFLSLKPLLVVINADEELAPKLHEGAAAFGLEAIAGQARTEVVALSAKLEAEIGQLDGDDAKAFMDDLEIREPALDRMIRASYHLLDRISFFTVGDDECRAWTIGRGTDARKAAGAIHSDIERGFIRAELVAYNDLDAAGSWSACRDNGTLRLEGKEYPMQDGDVVNFRFNV